MTRRYQTHPDSTLELGIKARRQPQLTDEQVAADEARRAALAEHQRNVFALDHHWDAEHPDYDPTCECGLSPEARQRMVMSLAAGAEYEAQAPDRRRMRKAMSPGQRGYLQALASRITDPQLLEELHALLTGEVDFGMASRFIDRIKDASRHSVRPNRYAGECYRCHGAIEAEAGHLSQLDGRWVVEHVGPCPEAAPEPAEPVGLDLRALRPGRYAVPGGATRLKLMVRRPDRGNWAGYTFVSDAAEYGVRKNYGRQGPGERDRYRGEVTEALEAILANPLEAMQEYGRLTGTCGNCFRPLEDEQSVERGIGPVCYGRMLEVAL